MNEEGDYEVGVEALPVSRATKRAVLSTVERLRKNGHSVVPFNLTLKDMDDLNYAYLG